MGVGVKYWHDTLFVRPFPTSLRTPLSSFGLFLWLLHTLLSGINGTIAIGILTLGGTLSTYSRAAYSHVSGAAWRHDHSHRRYVCGSRLWIQLELHAPKWDHYHLHHLSGPHGDGGCIAVEVRWRRRGRDQGGTLFDLVRESALRHGQQYVISALQSE